MILSTFLFISAAIIGVFGKSSTTSSPSDWVSSSRTASSELPTSTTPLSELLPPQSMSTYLPSLSATRSDQHHQEASQQPMSPTYLPSPSTNPDQQAPPQHPIPPKLVMSNSSTYSPPQPWYVSYGSSPLSHYLKYRWLIRPDSSAVSSNHQLAKPVDTFATTMYEIVSKAYPTKNMIISPLSIQTILSLVAMAARGSTKTQMATALDFPNSNPNIVANDFQQMLAPYQNNTMLNMANAIYISNEYTIQPGFQEIATNQYYANVQTVNYGDPTDAAQTINTWVSSKTDDKINSLIDSAMLTPSTNIVLVNAVYFNGSWKHPFDHQLEMNIPFFGPTCKTSGNVNMMSVNANFNFGVIPSLNATVLELPYKNSNLSMLIFLPDNCSEYNTFNNMFGTFDFTSLHSQLYYRDVDVLIPDFSSTFEIANMIPELTAAGMGVLFSNPNLSGMLDTLSGSTVNDLVIGGVIHKAQIEVNRLGAEAAAATGVRGLETAVPPLIPQVQFHVDRSFTYAIMDKQTCIFIGQYLQPESS